MNDSTRCIRPDSDELAARYAVGSLPEPDLTEFESHMLECADCQARVQEAAALGAALRGSPAGATRRIAIASVLAAAAVTAVLLLPQDDSIRSLGQLGDPLPGFDALPVRTDAGNATSLADRGMAAYARGDLDEAAILLAQAAEGDPSPGVRFFAGVAALGTGRPTAAVEQLQAVALPTVSPYSEEASFYLAKAYLALGQASQALEALAALDDPAGALTPRARALADSVLAARR